jgi:hypothetical protein
MMVRLFSLVLGMATASVLLVSCVLSAEISRSADVGPQGTSVNLDDAKARPHPVDNSLDEDDSR